MKKTRMIKLGAILISLTLISVCWLGVTYAKYISNVSGTDSVRVAKFAYTVKDQNNTVFADSTRIKIFETSDTGVKNLATDTLLVAPGTTGSFSINVANTSEVIVDDTFDITYTNANSIPIYFTFDGKKYSDVLTTKDANVITGDIDDLAAAISAKQRYLAIDNGTATYPITWTWDFEGKFNGQTDASDTALGVDGTYTVEMLIDATIAQLDNRPGFIPEVE